MEAISIVIPVRGRVNYLKKLFESIAKSKEHTSFPIEVIVVDDSERKTQLLIKSLCNIFKINYYYLRGGISKKRNYGIKMAKSPIVLFTDSDCQVDPNLFNEHLKYYVNEEIGGCLGITEFVGKKTLLWNIIEKMPFLQPFQWAKWKNHVSWGPCTNISFRKEVLEKVNGFKSMLPPKECGEDVDLGHRITALGYKICCNADARVYHTRETWAKLSQFIERTFRFGRGEYYLMKKHPENTFLDVPKNSLIFFFLVILFVCKASIGNTLLLIIIPFLWLLTTILIQSLLALKCNLIKSNRKDIGYVYFSLLFDFLFEVGTTIECIRKGGLKFLRYRYIYTEDQLLSRWHWGVIKVWSFIISLFALFIVLLLVMSKIL